MDQQTKIILTFNDLKLMVEDFERTANNHTGETLRVTYGYVTGLELEIIE